MYKTDRFGRLNKDDVISEENVRRKGERTAVRAVQSRLGLENNRFMRTAYYNLIRDMDNFDVPGYTLTESYDIAQEAIMFLCQHMGRKLTDTVIDRKGEPVTILKACFRVVNAYTQRQLRKAQKTVHIEDLLKPIEIPFEWEIEEEDYTGVKETIEAMKLTERQNKVLWCKMAGRTQKECALTLSLIKSSIQKSMRAVKAKYLKTFCT